MWEAILGHIPAQARVAWSDATGLRVGSVVCYVHFFWPEHEPDGEICKQRDTYSETPLAGAVFLSGYADLALADWVSTELEIFPLRAAIGEGDSTKLVVVLGERIPGGGSTRL